MYFREVVLGVIAIGVPALVILLIGRYSVLLVPVLSFPLLFVGLLQGMDHFARGYRAAVGVSYDDDPVFRLNPERFALPFRDGSVATADRDRSILVLGETGSGKTEAIKLLADQFPEQKNAPVVAFDYKNDYKLFFGNDDPTSGAITDGGAVETQAGEPPAPDENEDLIIISLEGSTQTWNLFEEVEDESDFEEIGRALFAEEEREATNPFFPKAARQVFVATLKYLYRWGNASEDNPDPSNELLVTTFEDRGVEELYKILKNNEHSDGLSGAAANISPDAPRQATGVYGHLQTLVSEVFKRDFAEAGEFSIKEYMKNPDGRTLILDFPIDRGESVKPIFRFYIDWAIRYGLDDTDQEAFFILDEFQTIPGLERVERLVNAGRARDAYGILGLQSKTQLHDTYGKAEGEAILSGLAQEVLLRPGDSASVEHIRSRTGRRQRQRLVQGPTSFIGQQLTGRTAMFNQVTTEEEYQLSEAELQQFKPGEAIVLTQEEWRRGRLFPIDEVPEPLEDEGLTVRDLLIQWRRRYLAEEDEHTNEDEDTVQNAMKTRPTGSGHTPDETRSRDGPSDTTSTAEGDNEEADSDA
jgi:hypothetical protein